MQQHLPDQPRTGPLASCLEGPIVVLSLIGTTGITENVTGILERSQQFNESVLSPLTAALRAELDFLDLRLDFAAADEPSYPSPRTKELMHLATLYNMNAPLCTLACNAAAKVVVGRQYHSLEMTRLQALRDELARHIAQLTREYPVAGPPA